MDETPKLEELSPAAIAERVKANGGKPISVQLYFMHGIFGELPDCNGIAQEIIDNDEKLAKWGLDPKEGGTFIKLVGCSYLYEGNPKQEKVFGMEQAKSDISTLPRDIVGKSVLYSGAVALRFLLQRKKLIHDLHVFFSEIKHKTVRHVAPPEIRQKKCVREIRRAMDVALKRALGIDPSVDLLEGVHLHNDKHTKLELAAAIAKATLFVTTMMELDGAYCFPTQDALGEKDTENARRSGYAEAMRLFDVMIARQKNLTPVPGISDRVSGVPFKFIFIKRVVRAALILSPTMRRIAREFLVELDAKKVGLSEANWYFCLRRNTHNYRGMALPLRLLELERIDRERGHQYVQIEFIKSDKSGEQLAQDIGPRVEAAPAEPPKA